MQRLDGETCAIAPLGAVDGAHPPGAEPSREAHSPKDGRPEERIVRPAARRLHLPARGARLGVRVSEGAVTVNTVAHGHTLARPALVARERLW